MNKKVFSFEAYLKSPQGQSNWEIHHINVFAKNETQARMILKFYPKFDRIIHYKGELTPTEMDIQMYTNDKILFRRVPLNEIEIPTFN